VAPPTHAPELSATCDSCMEEGCLQDLRAPDLASRCRPVGTPHEGAPRNPQAAERLWVVKVASAGSHGDRRRLAVFRSVVPVEL
jgi:hypothetical protein